MEMVSIDKQCAECSDMLFDNSYYCGRCEDWFCDEDGQDHKLAQVCDKCKHLVCNENFGNDVLFNNREMTNMCFRCSVDTAMTHIGENRKKLLIAFDCISNQIKSSKSS